MTLKQMEYALMTAKCGSLSEASKKLFVSQPSLSEAIKKLEGELGIQIFERDRNGVQVTPEGEEFLGSAQSILDQISNIQHQSEIHNLRVEKASISTIHYFFMGEVFAELVNRAEGLGLDTYDLRLNDAGTLEVIEDVTSGASEVGIISYTEHNKAYIMRELKKTNLECYELISKRLCAFLRGAHPLSREESITMKDLEPYTYASIWQNKSDMYYFTEEGIFMPANRKKVYVKDCGAMRVLLRETDVFAMGLGVMPSDVSQLETCSVEVSDAPITSMCWIKRSGHDLSGGAKEFLRICASKLGRSIDL